ncbi:MAG: tripartite tricarboxylate transporter TctB family protein [Pseudomonadota bacterium]
MRRAELITAVVLGLFSIYLMWKSGEPVAWDPDAQRFDNIGFIEGEGPASGFWPFWLSFAMLLCCVWIGVNWLLKKSPPSQSDEPFLDGYGRRTLLFVGGGLLGFLASIQYLGFYGAIFLFLIYFKSLAWTFSAETLVILIVEVRSHF